MLMLIWYDVVGLYVRIVDLSRLSFDLLDKDCFGHVDVGCCLLACLVACKKIDKQKIYTEQKNKPQEELCVCMSISIKYKYSFLFNFLL